MGHKVREAKEWVARREYGWEVTLWEGEDEERLVGEDGSGHRYWGCSGEFQHLVTPSTNLVSAQRGYRESL